jgi:AraC-like DNA-binding protein
MQGRNFCSVGGLTVRAGGLHSERAMIVTTQFPDLPPRPETAANAAFRRRFFARWGQENSVFLASTCRAEFGPLPTAPSLKMVLDGAMEITLGRRRVRLEPGALLWVNGGDTYAAQIRSPRAVHCFSLHFRPALADEVAAAAGCDWTLALERGSHGRRQQLPLLRDALRGAAPALAPLLARIRTRVLAGDRDGGLYEEDFVALIGHLLADERRARTRLQALSAARPATREELARRIGWATDFMRGRYAEPIGLAEIAAAAHLSKFHLLRAFRELEGCTPHQYLQARRVEAARRLLAEPALDLEAVAAASGFGSRWTLQRALRRQCGASGRTLRLALS